MGEPLWNLGKRLVGSQREIYPNPPFALPGALPTASVHIASILPNDETHRQFRQTCPHKRDIVAVSKNHVFQNEVEELQEPRIGTSLVLY
jgi:hypothetical protein